MTMKADDGGTDFATLANIVGEKKMAVICRVLSGRKIHIRKSTKFAATEFQKLDLLNSKESAQKLAVKLGCSIRYFWKLRSIARKEQAAKLRTSAAKS